MSLKKSGISIKEVKRILKDNYNISGSLKKLDGEIDYNYRVQLLNDKKFLLKISRSNFNSDYIDYQIKLLDHLNEDCNIDLASNINTINGKKVSKV